MSTEVTVQSIFEALKVPQEHWGHVLECLHNLELKNATPSVGAEPKQGTIAELRALPAAARDAILEAQAEHAAADYRNDPDLTAFEPCGLDDLHGHVTDAPSW